jgi:8-oxo-dGTP pyrophosphatase MutT (NUDIX family)
VAKTQQVAALPWRQGENGIEILLVTTRTTKRWVIPKGWTMDGKADFEAAAIEAYEEAGVVGVADIAPVGRYGYLKILQSGKPRRVNVRVFAMAVNEVLMEWPERHERERQWVSPQRALALIGEPELLPIVASFAKIPLVTRERAEIPQGDPAWTISALLKSMLRWFKV